MTTTFRIDIGDSEAICNYIRLQNSTRAGKPYTGPLAISMNRLMDLHLQSSIDIANACLKTIQQTSWKRAHE